MTYVGTTNSSDAQDQVTKSSVDFKPEEFKEVFGYRAPFAKTSIKKVKVRENSIFKRTTIVVKADGNKVNKYHMYFNKIAASGKV